MTTKGVIVGLCTGPPDLLDDDAHPGFGCVTLCQNGVVVGKPDADGKRAVRYWTSMVRRLSKPMCADVWTLHVEGPFDSACYAFTPDERWTIIERGEGFA